jgi:hypothetical protein
MPTAIKTAPAAPKNAAPSPVAIAPSPAQVFENKIAGQLQHSNQMDSRQPNLSTSVPKSGLTQSNHIRKHHGARSPILEKITHFELSPRHRDPASPSTKQPAPNAVENRHPWGTKRGIPPTPLAQQHQHQPAQVSENKIAGQLLLLNQMNSGQSNLSTTVSKRRLMPWNQIRTRQEAPREKSRIPPAPAASYRLRAVLSPGTPTRYRMATRPPRSSPICQE